ncbi:MAG: DNA mismatch repair endonuclease MutL [Cytophagaceae bacterium]|jgi:DNA mismatch repair protein MutL|nr:DNA mismatch repair endonuclease MutL [Cytophagaceae bacterium]
MSDIIQLLPENIANQIAAGEVVQRPASVVKELMENSIDAGADKISLIVKDAGKLLVQVIDNGKGMSERDARMCFERHATSKIKQSGDLFKLHTYGFRGEAMASIAAVAQVELRSKREEDEWGTAIRMDGSELKAQEPVACDKGTSIAVRNLFYNVPARRNFLKSNSVELRHIFDEFHRIALAYPAVAMSLHQNDLEVYNLPKEKLAQRVVNIFGKSYQGQLISCSEDTDVLKIQGYIGKPEFAKKSRGEQFFFVNGRYIRSNYLHHAVSFAYGELLGDDNYPFYVLFLTVDPAKIDVNVHPTKTEIKFEDEKTLYHILRATVKKALATHNIIPAIDYDLNVNFGISPSEMTQGTNFDLGNGGNTFQKKKNNQDWQSLLEGFRNTSPREEPSMETLKFESKINDGNNERLNKDLLYSDNTTTFQLHQRYIVTQIKSGMALIDQQAAHERILYEKYLNMLQNKYVASQQFLFPQSIELNASDFELVMEMEEEIKALGFVFNVFGKNTIVVNGIPADLPKNSDKNVFENLIEEYKRNQSELQLNRHENLALSIARKSAIKAGTKLTLTEMNSLIDQLFACKVPNYAPGGNQTVILLSMEKIAQLFN